MEKLKIMLNIYLLRRNLIIKKLYLCGAISEETAKTLEEVGVGKPDRFVRINDKLQKQKILVKTKDNKYYLNK
ncbi:MAG: hypothetical protein IJB83_03515 [Bacilli bacterium]|nr:hypothetical protein [Bacilli bacterium]